MSKIYFWEVLLYTDLRYKPSRFIKILDKMDHSQAAIMDFFLENFILFYLSWYEESLIAIKKFHFQKKCLIIVSPLKLDSVTNLSSSLGLTKDWECISMSKPSSRGNDELI